MKEYLKYLGHNALWKAGKMTFEVKLTDVKQAYGDIRFRIEPNGGFGHQWVSISSLGLPEIFSLKGFNQPKEEK